MKSVADRCSGECRADDVAADELLAHFEEQQVVMSVAQSTRVEQEDGSQSEGSNRFSCSRL